MVNTSVSDRARTINLSIKQSALDELIESTAKASALAEVALCADFWSCEHRTQYDYLWLLSDLLVNIKTLCEQLELRPPKKEDMGDD